MGGQFQNGNQALQHLVEAARQRDELSRWRSQFEPHLGQFQQFMGQQQRAAAEQRQKANQWFNAPEYNPDWSRMVQRDAQGNLVAAPGAPQGVVEKYLQAMQHSRGFLEKFSFDPIGAIRPGIEQVVKEIASQLVQQNLGGYAEQNEAQNFVQQNRTWLFDQSGQPTQWHGVFAGAVREAEQLGVRSVQGQQQYAMKAVQHAYAVSEWQRLNGTQAAQPAAAQQLTQNQQQKNAFLQQTQQNAALPPGNPGAAHQPAAQLPAQPRSANGDHRNRIARMALANAAAAGINTNGTYVPG
jgi:hypothetical protein